MAESSEQTMATLKALKRELQEVSSTRPAKATSTGREETPGSLMKPVAMTVRLDQERYERLSEYAARFVPRKSFQAIIVAAIDSFLDT